VADEQHDNHNLLVKIYAILRFVPNITFHRVSTKDQRYRAAKRLADEAAERRASQEVRHHDEEWDLEEWDEDTEIAYRNALAKDP
jgi:hypothetical protein